MSDFEKFNYPNGVLANKLNIHDAKKLNKIDYLISSENSKRLLAQNYLISGIRDLNYINRYLFEDIYDWAGQFRDYDISKQGHYFQPHSTLDIAANYIDREVKLIIEKNYEDDKLLFSNDIGQLLSDINELHPFREGNGRTQRLFIELLAMQKAFILRIDTKKDAYKQYMDASKSGESKDMATAILTALTD